MPVGGSKPGEHRGGRKRGTPNRVTTEVRAIIGGIAQRCASQVEAWIAAVEDPGKRLDLYLRMLEYHIPKLGRIEVTGKDGGPMQVNLVNYSPSQQLGSKAIPDEGVVRTRTGVPPRRPLPP